MRESDFIMKNTDFISEKQDVLVWLFNSADVQRSYNTYAYSDPVKSQLLKALKKISDSKNKNIRGRKFTVFAGDVSGASEMYCVAVPAKTSSRITDILTGCFENVRGFETMEYGKIPVIPLIPKYRYETGTIIEYTSDSDLAGTNTKFEDETLEINIFYRTFESAESFDGEEKYSDSGAVVIH